MLCSCYMLEILARSHAILDRFRSKQFCGFLLLWANDWSEEVFVFIYLSLAFFFIPLRSYANVQHFLTSWIHTGTKRRYFDILHVPLMHSRSSGRHHVVSHIKRILTVFTTHICDLLILAFNHFF